MLASHARVGKEPFRQKEQLVHRPWQKQIGEFNEWRRSACLALNQQVEVE